MRKAIPVERCRQLFRVNEQGQLVRLVDVANRMGHVVVRAGDLAGSLTNNGYLCVMVEGKLYQVHRVVWAMATGDSVFGALDHINGVRTDNRIENLRLAEQDDNAVNRVGKGVYLSTGKRDKPFMAIVTHRKQTHRAYFATEAEGREWYLSKKLELARQFVEHRQEFIGRCND